MRDPALDNLYAALTAERYNQGGWNRNKPHPRRDQTPTYDDTPLTCARRRRELADAWNQHAEERSA